MLYVVVCFFQNKIEMNKLLMDYLLVTTCMLVKKCLYVQLICNACDWWLLSAVIT